MKTLSMILALIVGCALTQNLEAKEKKSEEKKERISKRDEMIKQFDRDGDGRLNKEEKAAMKEANRTEREAKKKELEEEKAAKLAEKAEARKAAEEEKAAKNAEKKSKKKKS